MKTAILVVSLLLATSALAFPGMSEKDFEKKFHEKFEIDDPELEKEAGEELEKEEEEIEEEHEEFEEGKANFDEQVEPWDDMDPEEFNKEKTGLELRTLEPYEPEYYTGLIWEERENTPEELEMLEEIYEDMDERSLPASYDSRTLGIVTKVKNQGSCGSCASFASAGNIEICLKKAGGAPTANIDISEQQMLDCAYDGNKANGCNGAGLDAYTKYMVGKKFLHENTYGYTANTYKKNCPSNKAYWSPGAKITKAVADHGCNDSKIMHMIKKYGSALIAVYASDKGFKNYKSGVFDKCNSSARPNHAVLAVGWGTSNNINYWIIKNSWGTNWGDKGFIKLKRGTCGANRECGTVLCTKNGSPGKVPKAPKKPKGSVCDVSKYFGKVTGTYYLVNHIGGTFRKPLAKCNKGKCSPVDSKHKNACKYICGKNPCK